MCAMSTSMAASSSSIQRIAQSSPILSWWHSSYLKPIQGLFSWGCRIHQLLLWRGLRPSCPNKCPGYDTKQSDGEVPVMLELWGMWSTPSLPSLPGPLWPGMVASDKGSIYGLNRTKMWFEFSFLYLNYVFMLNWIVKIELFWHLNCVLMLNWIIWNKTVLTLTLCIAQSAGAVEYTDCSSAEG